MNGGSYNGVGFIDSMAKFRGKEVTISDVYCISGRFSGKFHIEEDNWIWSIDMVDVERTKQLNKIKKIWELEEGKFYKEVNEDGLIYMIKYKEVVYSTVETVKSNIDDWSMLTDDDFLTDLWKYEFYEVESPFIAFGKRYYTIRISPVGVSVKDLVYYNDVVDEMNINSGNFFRTIEEAEKKAKQISEILKGE